MVWYADYDEGLEKPPCNGTGVLNCYCGGDFCVCGHQGEVPCPGCDDCDCEDDWNYEDDWEFCDGDD